MGRERVRRGRARGREGRSEWEVKKWARRKRRSKNGRERTEGKDREEIEGLERDRVEGMKGKIKDGNKTGKGIKSKESA